MLDATVLSVDEYLDLAIRKLELEAKDLSEDELLEICSRAAKIKEISDNHLSRLISKYKY